MIELLVVIAIIALLIGILLPALGKARLLAWQSISLSNLRQVMVAFEGYRIDNNEDVPHYASGYNKATRSVIGGWCTWAHGGQDPGIYWRGVPTFDLAASGRPLNQYLYSEYDYPDPFFSQNTDTIYRAAITSRVNGVRQNLPHDVFRAPGDKATRQQSWPRPTFDLSSYEDVGTSYHTNVKWFSVLQDSGDHTNPNNFSGPYNEGMRRLRIASSFSPSKFVYIYDQAGDIVTSEDGIRIYPGGIEGDYGEMNKGVMAFYDGHVEYLPFELGAANTEDYNLHFTLRTDDGP